MTVLRATTADLLSTLAAEQAAQREGNRNTELFRRARVALEAGYEPEDVRTAMASAGRASGLDVHEVKATLASALRAERAERIPDGTPPQAPSLWRDTWERTWPRLIAVDAEKRPMQRWQYGWDEPNDETREGATYLSVVIPPGLAVLDVDNASEFAETDLDVPESAPRYPSISGKSGKGHIWFRLHPDRPYPTRTMRAWPGADLLVGGMGIANIKDASYLDIIGDPAHLPLAPDWMQPRPGSRVKNIKDYLKGVPDTIPWVIDKVAFIHGLTLLAGSPKAGKSTASFEMMRCRETGEGFLEQFVTPGPTLLVTEEGGVSVKFKGDALAELDVYDRKASEGESFEATLGVIADWSAENPGGLVFIDTLAAWAQVEDENDSAEMQKAIDGIRLAISEPHDVAVILIHHARKGGGEGGEGIRGSGAILAAVDHVIELKRADKKRPNRRVFDIMSRVLRESERWTADWEDGRYNLAEEDEGEVLEDLEDDVALIPFTGPGTKAADINLGWRRLAHLVNLGRVRKVEGAGNKPALYWGIPPATGGKATNGDHWRREEDE